MFLNILLYLICVVSHRYCKMHICICFATKSYIYPIFLVQMETNQNLLFCQILKNNNKNHGQRCQKKNHGQRLKTS